MGNEQSTEAKNAKSNKDKPSFFDKARGVVSSIPFALVAKLLQGPLINVASKFGKKIAEEVKKHPVAALIIVGVVVVGGVVYIVTKKYRGDKSDKALVLQRKKLVEDIKDEVAKEKEEYEKVHADQNGDYHLQYYTLIDEKWSLVDVGSNVSLQVEEMLAIEDGNASKQLVAYNGPELTVAVMESKEISLNSLVLCQVNADQDEMINFYVCCADGQRLTISAHKDWPIEYLTFIVQHVLGIGPENQQFSYGDRTFTEGTFQQNGIVNDAEINLIELESFDQQSFGPIIVEQD